MGPTAHDYQMADFAGSACNLSGIAHSLSDVLKRVWEEARELGKGTEYVNTHPIVQAYVYQMFFLAFKRESFTVSEAYGKALDYCKERSREADGASV